jgi:OmpA-OmpF porin, OOP family
MMNNFVSWFIFFASPLFFLSPKLLADPDKQQSVNDGYVYLGARVAYTYNEKSCTNKAFNCDHTGTGYGIFAGYQFTPKIAAEFSFNDLADSTAEYQDLRLVGKSRETDLALKLSHYFTDTTQIYAKTGAAYWDGEVTGRDPVLKESRVRLLLGTGVEFSLSSRWNARIEYQYIHQIGNSEMGYANPHLAGLALLWKFPTKKSVTTPLQLPLPPPQPTPAPVAPPAPEQRIVVNEEHGGPLFDSNKSEIRHTAAIDQVISILLKNSDLRVTIVGHTDSRGSHQYNKKLSENRAQAVANYLHYKGVALDRIKTFGMGEDQPVADNETDQGRSKNRRVEFVISAIKTLS